ncbi:MAG: radical SAM protein [Deltaproteobacteria bacterium]|nr:radical SAM protein [Deltaproteobacteria bacterium]
MAAVQTSAQPGRTGIRWLELSPGYACNCRCLGCHSCSPAAKDQMDWPEVSRWLQQGRRMGAQHLWLSGGEPTLRKDFLQTLRLAKHLGYQRIKVQSNGMLFSYPDFARRAVAAGMNEVNLLLKSLDPKTHDAHQRTPHAHELLTRGVAVLSELPLRLEGDILITTRNYTEVADLVAHYGAKGLVHFNFWLFSPVDQGDLELTRQVPRMSDTVPYLLQARERASALGATVCSLNTPHCAVPPEAWDMQFDAAGMKLWVVNPGGIAFPLEQSRIEHGEAIAACQGCAARPWCRGIRPDYVAIYGETEFAQVRPEALARGDPRGSQLDR